MATERDWISISDLMSVLMIVFLFIAIVFMLQVREEQKEVRSQHAVMGEIAEGEEREREQLLETMEKSFEGKLAAWNAEMTPSGGLRFSHPDGLFAVGKDTLSEPFKEILAEFFPSYVDMLVTSGWQEKITDVRINGHSSSDWQDEAATEDERYLHNVHLSQQRALAVFAHVYQLQAVASRRPWLRKVLRANGLANSQPVTGEEGREDHARSRRVEFHAHTDASAKLQDILNLARQNTGN